MERGKATVSWWVTLSGHFRIADIIHWYRYFTLEKWVVGGVHSQMDGATASLLRFLDPSDQSHSPKMHQNGPKHIKWSKHSWGFGSFDTLNRLNQVAWLENSGIQAYPRQTQGYKFFCRWRSLLEPQADGHQILNQTIMFVFVCLCLSCCDDMHHFGSFWYI